MRHEQVIDNLSGYIEGTLDGPMQSAVENHIRNCAECYRELADLRSIFSLLDSPVMAVEPPGRFHDDVMRRIRLQQHEAAKPGFWARLGWGWSAVAGTAAAAALFAVVMTAPRNDTSTAGFVHVPRWSQAAGTAKPTTEPDLIIGADGPAVVGQEYHLNLDFLARHGGAWSLSVQTSPGIQLLNAGGPADENGAYHIWQGTLDDGAKTGLSLVLQPTRSGAVQEIVVRFRNLATGDDIQRVVFVPVGTGGSPSANVDWQSHPNQTIRQALEDMAYVYGVTVVAPADLLDNDAQVRMNQVNAGQALQFLAQGNNLRWTIYNQTYNVYQ